MADLEFFPQRPESHPTVYAYKFIGVDSHKGYIKVGYTERDVETRIKEQIHTAADVGHIVCKYLFHEARMNV